MRLALLLLSLAIPSSCSGKKGDSPPTGAAIPVEAKATPASPADLEITPDKTHASLEVALAVGTKVTREIAVPTDKDVRVTAAHVAGDVGRFDLSVFDPDALIESNAMTCVEPGCSQSMVIASKTTRLRVVTEASVPMRLRIEASLAE